MKWITFEAEDCNDEHWDEIIEVLKENLKDFRVMYGDGDYMDFIWSGKNEQKTGQKI